MLRTNRRSRSNSMIDETSQELFHDIVKVSEEVWYKRGLEFGIASVSGELDTKTVKHLNKAIKEIALATDIYLQYANHEQLLTTQMPMTVNDGRDLPLESAQSSLSPPQNEQ